MREALQVIGLTIFYLGMVGSMYAAILVAAAMADTL